MLLAIVSLLDPAAATGPDGQPLIRALSHHAVFLLLVQLAVLRHTNIVDGT